MMQRSCTRCAPCERPVCGCPDCSAEPPCPPHNCHYPDCRCAPPPIPPCPPPSCCPPRPFPSNGFLLPRIVAAGREWQRRCSLTLTVDGLPLGAEPPLTLLEVTSCGQPTWETLDCPDPRGMLLRVRVPLACLVRDRCNQTYTGRSAITVDVRLRLSMPYSECWRGSLIILPCVRLICTPCPANEPTFDVLLEVLAEAYLARWEPCLCGTPKPACPPDLPLFPQPCFH